LSRMRLDTALRDPSIAKKLNLLKELQSCGNLDREVLLSKQKMPVRLVAIKLPEAIAAERRRKAKCNRDKRCNPNERRLKMLGWVLFVTNLPKSCCTAKIYGFHWRIENIFKIWKSQFRMTEVPNGSAEQLRVVICARLISITFLATFSRKAWQWECKGSHCSMFKMAALLSDYFLMLCFEAWDIRLSKAFLI